MPAAAVPISPASNSGRKSLARTFLRSRLSYKNMGKSKCRSTMPWPCRRVIRSSVDSGAGSMRSEEHTSELQSLRHLVCRLLLEKKIGVAQPGVYHLAIVIQHVQTLLLICLE